jgi:PGM1 C-terminal domain
MRADPEVARLQARLRPLGLTGLPGHGERTIVVLPSFDLDPDMLERHRVTLPSYEERALYMLFLLRRPHVRIVLVTSTPVPAEILDYVLRLIPDTDPEEARSRLTLLAVEDDSPRPLAVKLLDRPDLVSRLSASIHRPEDAFVSPYNVADAEREVALRLGIPLYCPDDRFYDYGTKNGGRRLFAEVGVAHALGAEGVAGVDDLVREIAAIRRGRDGLGEVVVKQNDTVYGEGNVVLAVGDLPAGDAGALEARIREGLSDDYLARLAAAPGIVEEMLAGDEVVSPSVQQRIIAGATPGLVCTHDQVLGGPNGQMYTGGRFPAAPGYAAAIAEEAARVRARLMGEGVVGRFGIDFVVTRSGDGPWGVFAVEVNLREGGTSHPFGTLYLLTGGGYDPQAATYRTARGAERFYEAGDAIADERWSGRTAAELLTASARAGIGWDAEAETGVVFHMLRSLEPEGRYGATCIAPTAARAHELFEETSTLLDGGG